VLQAARLKAAELEQHGGVGAAAGAAGGSDDAMRRGAQAARAFLAELNAMPAEQRTPDALRAAKERMLTAGGGSAYLAALVEAAK